MRRPRQTLAAALLLPLLAACGGAPQASDPPPAAEPTATASRTQAPAAPAAARQAGSKGAAAFVEHWVEILNFAGLTGDTEELARLSTADCVRCEALVEGIDRIYASGGRIEGGGWTVKSTRPYGTRQQRFFIDAVIDSAPQVVKRADGREERFDGATNRLRAFVLERSSDSWRVAELDPTA
jgi:hypothetical protein